jgi:hypothetical protein
MLMFIGGGSAGTAGGIKVTTFFLLAFVIWAEVRGDPDTTTDGIVVIGLGRFGGAVAQSLVHLGHEVLAIDEDADLVHRWLDKLTHVVQADATDSDALRQLGVQDLGRGVVGIGTDIEASVLSVLASTNSESTKSGPRRSPPSMARFWSAPGRTTSCTRRPRWVNASLTWSPGA